MVMYDKRFEAIEIHVSPKTPFDLYKVLILTGVIIRRRFGFLRFLTAGSKFLCFARNCVV